MDDGSEDKKAECKKKCVIKRKNKFKSYKNCLEAAQLENNKSIVKTQQRFKSERHNAFTEEIYKIALNSNDDKRMQSIDSMVRANF